MEIEIPLKDKIEQRLGRKLSYYHKTKEDIFIVYKEDPYIHGPILLLIFHPDVNEFFFNKQRYTVEQFSKVLDLLVFL